MVSANNGKSKKRKRYRKADTMLCTQMENRTFSFHLKKWMQNREKSGEGI
ncbi:hypothetical protein C823_001298 [Eubacterium plexicaudatum ASF492]|nr:hypothetical protein C823_001298 [Eubacterium plexicaudatum ASF492]